MYERLQKVNVCMSHVTTNRLMNLIGVGHDTLVKTWRDKLVADLKEGLGEVGCDNQTKQLSFDVCFHRRINFYQVSRLGQFQRMSCLIPVQSPLLSPTPPPLLVPKHLSFHHCLLTYHYWLMKILLKEVF